MDEEDVNRILDNLCLQGNAWEVSMWVWANMCSDCKAARRIIDGEEQQDAGCLQGRFMSRQGEK